MKRLFNGNILVKFDTDLITQTESGLQMAVDYDREFYQGVTGTVIKVCEETHIRRDWHPSLRVDCQVGDRVIMHYMGCQNALESGLTNNKNGTWSFVDGHFQAVINYAFVMAFERDGILKAAPGYVLARRVAKPKTAMQWIKVERDTEEALRYEIVKIGEDIVTRPGTSNPSGLQEGDIVLTDANCEYQLESPEKLFILTEPLVCFEKHLIYGIAG